MVRGPSGSTQIVAVGPGLKRFKQGDRVIIYHISGCGVCYDCRRGYMISCTSEHRAAYGWQQERLARNAEGSVMGTVTSAGTPHYMAPEIAACDPPRYGRASDMYALGVIVNEVVSRQRPYADKTTALAVHAAAEPTHIAGLPLAVNIQCHACRHASEEV